MLRGVVESREGAIREAREERRVKQCKIKREVQTWKE
jgi:hypothetical protein